MRGFFQMEFEGATGTGAGALAFVDGKVAGIDTGGGEYKGTYTESGATVEGKVMLSLPKGGLLVTGAPFPAGTPPIEIPFQVSGEVTSQVIHLQTPSGMVSVRLVKLNDL